MFVECQKKFPELMMQWLNAKQGVKSLNLILFNSDGKYIIILTVTDTEKTALINNMVK